MDTVERLAQLSLIAIGAVVVTAAMDIAEGIFAPLALALVAGVVLSPLSDFWEKRGASPVYGAVIGLFLTLLAVGALVLIFQPVVMRMVAQAPKVWSDMQEVIHSVRGLIRGLSDMSDGVKEAISPETGGAAAAPAEDKVAIPSVTDAIMAAPAILSQILIFAGTLFFFLLTRSEIYSWVTLRLCAPGERAGMAKRLRRAERNVSRYFLTITMINAGLGAITAATFEVIGLPDAVIWGVVTFVINFVVYLGPIVYIVILLFVGVAEFDGVLSVAPAFSFMILNAIEGQFVTPALVGRHMSVNPLLVFLALIFGLWLWGPIGGIVAIPMMLWILVLNDAITDTEGATAMATKS
ncbi:AI-2E family transporter [Seohaeicola zhoushanensis]|uniref:AI-2E family transporter n=1 Tax=Seohaeicola zhoushanensis TaxID=1569283 RepID=A0A8J3GY34_9RHOB|nr:AI-2E family transporter [Seohaeicola zhoushanensis]GHF55068.1 AI-2E family transporter [Seohaeicola zhoushanensis]